MTNTPPTLIGKHPEICRLRQSLASLGASRGPLLILGDAGVGKTLVARLINERSAFAATPMHILDFALLSERDARIDSFGAEPPEVASQRKGALEAETTVFLKNVHRAAGYLQAQLAESLPAGILQRSPRGPTHDIRCRAILSCTGSALLQRPAAIEPVLLKYLRTLPRISLPTLAERPDDLPLLVSHFQEEYSGVPRFRRSAPAFDIDFLRRQTWPESVTSLKAFVRASLLDPGEEILQQKELLEVEKMLMCIEETKQFSLAQSTRTIENFIVDRVLQRMNLHKHNAARLLGITDANVRVRLSLKGA